MSSQGFYPDTVDGRKLSQAECDEMHFLMNTPEPMKVNGRPLEFPPYAYRPYPAAIYGVWTDNRKRLALLDVARANGLDLKQILQREEAESLVPKWDCLLVQNDRERQEWINKGWTDNPDEVEKAHDHFIANTIAVAAAERAFTDRRMSEKAKEEFKEADRANGEDHLLDLPVPALNKKRGRPSNAEKAAQGV